MASSGVLLVVFTLVIAVYPGKMSAFVKLDCKDQTVGLHGQQTLLDCVIHFNQKVQDPTIRVVTWRKAGDEDTLLFFHEGNLDVTPGYAFAKPSWNDKTLNVSLLIDKTSVKDEGDFECYVMTTSSSATTKTSLKVTAKYSKPAFETKPEKNNPIKKGTLTCETTGGYPKGQLRWFDQDDKEWLQNPETEVTLDESGLFSLSSTMELLQSSSFSHYTCKVFNAEGHKEDEATFSVEDDPHFGERKKDPQPSPDKATNVVAPVVVIGSLIVGLLIVLLILYRRRSQQSRRHSTAPLISTYQGATVVNQDSVPPVEAV